METLNSSELSINRRWKILSFSLCAAGVTGLTTAFGLLTKVLQERLGYSDAKVALVGSFGNLGSFSGFVCGYAIIYWGPKRAIQVASLLIFSGLFAMWLSVTDNIPSCVEAMCCYIFLAQIGAATISQGTMSSSLKVFPGESRSEIASLTKSYYGVAGAVLSVLSGTFFAHDDTGFVLFAAIFMSLCIFMSGSCIGLLPKERISYDWEKDRGMLYSLAPYYKHFILLMTVLIGSLAVTLTIKDQFILTVTGFLLVGTLLTIVAIPLIYYSPTYSDSLISALIDHPHSEYVEKIKRESIDPHTLSFTESGSTEVSSHHPSSTRNHRTFTSSQMVKSMIHKESLTLLMSVDGEDSTGDSRLSAYSPSYPSLDYHSDMNSYERNFEHKLKLSRGEGGYMENDGSYNSSDRRGISTESGGRNRSFRRHRLGSRVRSTSSNSSSNFNSYRSQNGWERISYSPSSPPIHDVSPLNNQNHHHQVERPSMDLLGVHKESDEDETHNKHHQQEDQEEEALPPRSTLIPPTSTYIPPSSYQSKDEVVTEEQKDYTLVEMIQTVRCWVVFFILGTIFGSCLLLINLIEPISNSQRISVGAPTLVFIINASSALGRISIGYLTYYFEQQVTMVQFMGLTALAVALVNFGIGCYLPQELIFYIFIALIGCLFGIAKVLQAASAVDMFGVTYVATNSGFYALAGAVGSYAIAYGCVALFHKGGDDCEGAACYQNVFFISSFLCCLGFLAAFVLDYSLKWNGD